MNRTNEPDDRILALQRIIATRDRAARERTTLGILYLQRGDSDAAHEQFLQAVAEDPLWTDAHEGLGSIAIKRGDFDAARPHFLRAIAVNPDILSARFALYDIEQALQNVSAALAHQTEILARQRLFTIRAPHEQRRVLVLLAPGDWKANVPVDFLIDFSTTTVHKLYLTHDGLIPPLPTADLVFCAIGESDASTPLLHQADALVAQLGIPCINRPQRILQTSRTGILESLSSCAELALAPTRRCSREELVEEVRAHDDTLLIRPVDSHAGLGLERFAAGDERDHEVRAYMERIPADFYYVAPFIDYKNADGYYRKYRIICVDGVPFPFHLAISDKWMIHYYNAPMRDHFWMREEEQRFLADLPGTMGTVACDALRAIATRTDLEYVGVDCSILPDGRLLVFEADPAMIVHHLGADGVFGYHVPYARAIYGAFERLMDRLRARS
ncbi:MAG: tetratricopeptide repeat protein [Vulcanimicrobiaceae bacterium]